MSDYRELVERLRAASHDERLSTGMLYRDAADAIERLTQELAAERERCARICEDFDRNNCGWDSRDGIVEAAYADGRADCAAAIRKG